MDTSSNHPDPVVEEQACGCKTTTYEASVSYEPCLACALKNAGLMLMEAGKRLEEQEAERLREAAELAEEQRKRAEGWIGGTD